MSLGRKASVALVAAISMVASVVGASATELKSADALAASAKIAGFQVEALSTLDTKESAPARAAANIQTVPYSPEFSTDPLTPSEVEPNGDSMTATPLQVSPIGAALVEGNIFPNGDLDFYSFTATAGDRIYAGVQTSFSANASSDSQLDVLDVDGTTSLEFDDDNGIAGGLSSSIAGTVIPANGTYFLRVKHFSATNQLRPYRVFFRRATGAPIPETEPNDATAQALPAGGHVSGSTSATTDVDLYSITLNAGDTVFMSLDLDPERDTVEWNGQVGLGGFNGFFLVANDAGGVGPDSEAFFMTVKDAGTYTLLVNVPTGGVTFGTYNAAFTVFPKPTPLGACTTYTSTDIPQTIPTGPGIVSSTITVPGNPRIADLDVAIQLNHTNMPDLDVHLRSPAGNDNGLFTDIGNASQAPMDLVIDDEAGIPIGLFTVVSGMHYSPELAYRTSWFDGENAGGVWTLDIRDDTAANGGTLTAWSLRICEPPPAPVCPMGTVATVAYSSDFEADDGGFTHSGIADEWERGLPTFTTLTTCNSGSNCWVTDLDNTYEVSSNQDLLSPAINLAGLQAPVVVRWAQRYQMENASFDRFSVDAQEAGGANPRRLFEWLDATMTNAVGNPSVTIQGSAGWSNRVASADSLAGLSGQLRFNLSSDTSVNFAGAAIDDVSVTACRPLSADAAITKTNGVASSVPGTNTVYTIVASNLGPDPITAGTVTDTFPAGTTCNWTCTGAMGGTCPASGMGNINAAVGLPMGGTATFTATCAISAAATGSLANTASIVAGVTDPVPGNNSATDTDTLTPQANLGISKTNGVTSVGAGHMTTYTIVASNAGPSNAPGSVITDNFTADLTNCSTTCVGAAGGTCPAGPVAGNINSVAGLPVGGTATYSATCTVSPAAVGSISNTASIATGAGITDPTPGNNSATDTDTVGLSSDVAITSATDIPDPVNAGTNLNYAVTAQNNGPSIATNLVITLPMPATTTFVSVAAPGSASCSAPAVGANGNISCTWASTPTGAGNARTLNAVVGVPANAVPASVLNSTATVAATEMDTVPANNSAPISTTVGAAADLAISKTDNALTAQVNSAGTYVITASNAGPSNAVGATVTDTFPANFTTGAWTCVGAGGGTCPANGSGNIAATVDIPANGSVTFSVAGTYGGAIGTVTNTANVAAPANAPDGNPANNSATDTTDIVSPATLSATKSVGGNFVVGGGVVYSIAITNSGPQAQLDNPGPEFVDVLPFGFAYISATATSGTLSYVPATRTLSWSGAVAVNQIIGITINGSIDPAAMGTTLSNQGAVQFDADGNGTNEATALSDDPGVVGTNDPTVITVGLIQAVPANNLLALLLLALAVGLTGMWLVRRV